MPNLLDHNDTKNIIIWLFCLAMGLAVYIYKEDQKDLSKQTDDFKALIKEECGELKSMYKEMKTEQKEMRADQRILIVDVAKLNAVREVEAATKIKP